jgi:uncharacterized oligopeptide transporter (OPT) family protein
MKETSAKEKSSRKISSTASTALFHIVVLFISAQLSIFFAGKLQVVGFQAAIIFLVCTFIIYCIAVFLADHLLAQVRK